VLALAWPGTGAADHVGVEASVSARLKERIGSSWVVEVRWDAICNGASAANGNGALHLIDDQTGGARVSTWCP
jgi:hypothetical protein